MTYNNIHAYTHTCMQNMHELTHVHVHIYVEMFEPTDNIHTALLFKVLVITEAYA